MKVSKEQLKVVIKEELDAIMKEVDKGPDIKQLGSLPDGGYRTIRDIAAANEPSNIKRGYDDRGDYYEFYKDASPQDLIRAAVKNAGLDPNSKDGMQMVHDLEAAVDLHVKRIADRRTNKDDLASRQPIKMTRKGTPNKQDMRDRKRDIEYKLGLEEVKAHEGPEEKEEHKGETKAEKEEHEKKESAAEEKKEHMKEDKQMEQIAESFRRFTKILKD
jgi:hypothetical protein